MYLGVIAWLLIQQNVCRCIYINVAPVKWVWGNVSIWFAMERMTNLLSKKQMKKRGSWPVSHCTFIQLYKLQIIRRTLPCHPSQPPFKDFVEQNQVQTETCSISPTVFGCIQGCIQVVIPNAKEDFFFVLTVFNEHKVESCYSMHLLETATTAISGGNHVKWPLRCCFLTLSACCIGLFYWHIDMFVCRCIYASLFTHLTSTKQVQNVGLVLFQPILMSILSRVTCDVTAAEEIEFILLHCKVTWIYSISSTWNVTFSCVWLNEKCLSSLLKAAVTGDKDVNLTSSYDIFNLIFTSPPVATQPFMRYLHCSCVLLRVCWGTVWGMYVYAGGGRRWSQLTWKIEHRKHKLMTFKL